MTEKQMKSQLGAVYYFYNKLQDALNRAHQSSLIAYDDYAEQAPCKAMNDVKTRFELSVAKKVTEITLHEAKKKVWTYL